MIKALVPAVKLGGRPAKHARRAIVDAIFYVDRTGCSWRSLPIDFPHWMTVYSYFREALDDALASWELETIQALLIHRRRPLGQYKDSSVSRHPASLQGLTLATSNPTLFLISRGLQTVEQDL